MKFEKTLFWVDAKRLTRLARFSPEDGGAIMFQPDDRGEVPFAKYLRMFHAADWDPDYPAILNISPLSISHVVEGQRRLQTYAHMDKGEIPVLHCYSRAECAYWVKEIYDLELTGGGL